MPELPEVETTVRDLNKKVLERTFVDVWTDFRKMVRLRQGCGRPVKKSGNFKQFKKEIKGKKIERVWRRGKNILFGLSDNKTLLIHQKLTGHLLFGKWQFKKEEWKSKIPGPLSEDPMNRFLHLIFWFDDGTMLALSDLRKFAKVELWDSDEFKKSEEIKRLGPEPLEKDFTFQKFKKALENKKGKIKQILMNQEVIAGIGNIYSDEILWKAKIHPFKNASKLLNTELKRIYVSLQKILKKAIEVKGESISDFRRLTGEKGDFDPLRKVYRREKKPCPRCGTKIKRLKLGGRSAHFCSKCQK